MLNSLFFFTYIFAGFVGFLAIILIGLLIRYKKTGNQKLLAAVCGFMVCMGLIDLMYFYIDFNMLRTGEYSGGLFLRLLDIYTFIGSVCFWAVYVDEKAQLNSEKKHEMGKQTMFAAISCLVLATLNYGVLMDEYYMTAPGMTRTFAVVIEIYLCIFMTWITAWHTVKGLSEILPKQSRVLIAFISSVLSINGLWNGFLLICIMYDWAEPLLETVFDPTSIFILGINFATVLLVYREDFSVMFHAERKTSESDEEKEIKMDPMDSLAEAHQLTERERQVMELAYRGMTNPEIAEELYISKYTVKRHMHNLFEKLDVSTRMELIHLINKDNGPGGPL